MQCERVQRDLQPYLDGALSSQDQAAMHDHLSGCRACAEEADAMRELGQVLSHGLKGWVDEGGCPGDVLHRLEESIAPLHKRPWWKTWPGLSGAAAVAAIFLIALVGGRMELSPDQLASLPFVNSLAAMRGDEADSLPELEDGKAVKLGTISNEQNGLVLSVQQIIVSKATTRITYTIQGVGLESPEFTPQLRGRDGRVISLQRASVIRRGDQLVVVADFDPVESAESLSLTVAQLKVTFPTHTSYRQGGGGKAPAFGIG